MGSSNNRVFRSEKNKAQQAKQPKPGNDQNSAPVPTAKDIDTWHKEAHEEGYQQGLKQAQKEIAEQKKQLLDVIRFFEQPLQAALNFLKYV